MVKDQEGQEVWKRNVRLTGKDFTFMQQLSTCCHSLDPSDRTTEYNRYDYSIYVVLLCAFKDLHICSISYYFSHRIQVICNPTQYFPKATTGNVKRLYLREVYKWSLKTLPQYLTMNNINNHKEAVMWFSH